MHHNELCFKVAAVEVGVDGRRREMQLRSSYKNIQSIKYGNVMMSIEYLTLNSN